MPSQSADAAAVSIDDVARGCNGGINARSARWSKLRNAFQSAVAVSKGRASADNVNVENGRCNSSSRSSKISAVHSKEQKFGGFDIFPRYEEALPGAADDGFVLTTYTLPDGSKVITKEASSSGGGRGGRVTLEQLFSHRVHGVDNTGNVRVWPAEQVLLHVLISGPLSSSLAGARILELGAGMSGLAGLGLATFSDPSVVVITDGNPDAVKSLKACVELNEEAGAFGGTKVSARKLVWDSQDKDGVHADILTACPGGFDIIIASDCLFFKDFHEDLISTIAGLLSPEGAAILVQPERGGTASLFVSRVAAAAAAAAATAKASNESVNTTITTTTTTTNVPTTTNAPAATATTANTNTNITTTTSATPTTTSATNSKGISCGSSNSGASVFSSAGGEGGSINSSTYINSSGNNCLSKARCPLLEGRFLARYDERIWNMHKAYLEKGRGVAEAQGGYVPDKHQPLLVELRRVGSGVVGGVGGEEIGMFTNGVPGKVCGGGWTLRWSREHADRGSGDGARVSGDGDGAGVEGSRSGGGSAGGDSCIRRPASSTITTAAAAAAETTPPPLLRPPLTTTTTPP